MKQAPAILVLSLSVLGCSFFPPEYKVPLSFSVHVSNDHGAVVGLKLRVTRFKTDELSKLNAEEQRAANPNQFVEIIAESVTDNSGNAYFNLSEPGHFTVQPEHPANRLDWIDIDAQADAAPVTVKLVWPTSSILQTKHLRGRITDGLMSSHRASLRQVGISLHSLVSFNQIATSKTTDDGSFQFADVPSGLYFLRIQAKGGKPQTDGSYAPEGDIAISVRQDAPRESLSIAVSNSSCGLFYDLEENRSRYKPEACFLGGKEVPCE